MAPSDNAVQLPIRTTGSGRFRSIESLKITLGGTACDYDVPLVGEASLPIDQALLGTWEAIPEDRDEQKLPEPNDGAAPAGSIINSVTSTHTQRGNRR